ncbi:MAG TPA: hypothetical protein VG268_11475 [Streptosporangiaceae bacterium]|nr:hypothetical protein [Streptosporangiaceae bacterium]
MTGRSWLRGLAQRAGTTGIILIVALVAVAAAAAGPIYYAAARTSILRDTITSQAVTGRGYEVNETGALPGLLPQLGTTEQEQLDHELGTLAGRGLFAPPIYSLEASLPLTRDATSIPLVWRTSVCAHLRINGHCPTAKNKVVISRQTAAVTGWRAGRRLSFAGENPLTVTGIYQRPDESLDYWFGRGSVYFPSLSGSAQKASPVDAMFTAQATLDGGSAQAQGAAVVDDLLQPGRVTGDELAQLQAAMTAFSQNVVMTNSQMLVTTSIPSTLQSVQSAGARWRPARI